MALKFHRLKVAEVVRETPDAVTIYFDVPENSKNDFQYKHGQYLTLKVQVNGEEYRRAYSLCTGPKTDKQPGVTSKRVEGGLVSNFLNDNLKAGDELEVMPPLGKFTCELNKDSRKVYVLLGAGSGITPLMSILKTILHEEEHSRVYLFYGNRDQSSIIFKNELDELEALYPDRLTVEHSLSRPKEGWAGLSGRIDKERAKELLKKYIPAEINKAEYFICGPNPMMEEVQLALADLDIPDKQVHREYFSSTPPTPREINEEVEDVREEKERKVVVILDGEEYEVAVQPDETILEAAIEADLDPPFSCQMGICTTCRAKMHSGKVKMDEREGLSDEEIEQGYVLTCQAHPLTPDVKVEYDL